MGHSESDRSDASPDEDDSIINGDDADWSDATPVCTRCLTPVDPLQHYCHICSNAVGQLTPYLPFVSIAYNYSFFDIIWTRLWFPHHESARRRMLYAFILIAAALTMTGVWIILLGAPFWWWKWKHTQPPGHCAECGYDLRATESRCPECGALAPIAPFQENQSLS